MSLLPAFILARSGSKDIPNKNLLPFAGKPLLAWSVLQARESELAGKVYVSSDSLEILRVAEEYGAIPIQRPDELAGDTASSEAGWLHALNVVLAGTGEDPEGMVCLQATSPLREPADIDGAIQAFRSQGCDSLFTDALLDDLCVWVEEDGELKGKTFDPWNRGRRQARRPLYLENGSIYIFKPQLLRETGNRLGGKIARYTMPYWKSFEIDTLENVELCEFYFLKNLLPYWKAKLPNQPTFNPDLLVYDFDGVMTDNRVLILQDGNEAVFANRADGWGIAQMRNAGYSQIILTTETNPVASARAKKLQIEALQGSANKARDLVAYCQANGIDLQKVLYVGNDVNDLEAMRLVGFSVAPADAHPDVLKIAKHVTKASGGDGVIKELAEWLLTTVPQP